MENQQKKNLVFAGFCFVLFAVFTFYKQIAPLAGVYNYAGIIWPALEVPSQILFLQGLGFLAAGILLLLRRKGTALGIVFAFLAAVAAGQCFLYARGRAEYRGGDFFYSSFFIALLLLTIIFVLLAVGAFRGKKRKMPVLSRWMLFLPAAYFFAETGLVFVIMLALFVDYGVTASVFFSQLLFFVVPCFLLVLGCVFSGAALSAHTLKEKPSRLYSAGRAGFAFIAAGCWAPVLGMAAGNILGWHGANDAQGLLWGFAGSITVLMAAGMIFAPFFLLYRPKLAKDVPQADAYAYIPLWQHILLWLLTFGVWYAVWIYKATKFLNQAPEEEQLNPTATLLLCLFVPFYSIYWYHKQGRRLDALSEARGIGLPGRANLYLVCGIFLPVVAAALMQAGINTICTKRETAAAPKQPVTEAKAF